MGGRQSTRKTPRYSVRLPVTIFHAGDVIQGVSQNLSEAGMFVRLGVGTSVFRPSQVPGAPLTVMFQVPGDSLELMIEAEVRWVDSENGIGIQFLALADLERRALARMLEKGPRVGPSPVATAAG